jgi:DNA-binding response OmpR family regulator
MENRMSVDLGANLFYASGAVVQLTPSEAEISHLLVESYPRTVSHELLIWGLYGDADEHFRNPDATLKVHICRLRKKFRPLGVVVAVGQRRGYRLVMQ